MLVSSGTAVIDAPVYDNVMFEDDVIRGPFINVQPVAALLG